MRCPLRANSLTAKRKLTSPAWLVAWSVIALPTINTLKHDALAPQFIIKLPHDVINGQPLKYRRTDDGSFILYSMGWNEKDDGGFFPAQ